MIIPAYMNKERQRGRGGRPLQWSRELNQVRRHAISFQHDVTIALSIAQAIAIWSPNAREPARSVRRSGSTRRDGVGRAREGGKMAQVTQSVANESESQ
jgi:hypothetical protein